MAQVPAAFRAQNLGTDHEVAEIPLRVDGVIRDWPVEAGPAAAGIELRFGIEQFVTAFCTPVLALALIVQVFACKRWFSPLFTHDPSAQFCFVHT